MSVLVVQIPARPRQMARSPGDSASTRPDEWSRGYRYALSSDGVSLTDHGQRSAQELPRADTVLAVMHDADISWHQPTLPKVAASKLRPLMVGSLEESLLCDPEQVHLALPSTWQAAQATWVAATQQAWLKQHLDTLEAADFRVDRVLTAMSPSPAAAGHFWLDPDLQSAGQSALMLSWSGPEGALVLPAEGGAAKALVQSSGGEPPLWTAEPEAVGRAEAWLGQAVESVLGAQRLLSASHSEWNLRQFALARSGRGALALRDAWRQFMSPTWRATRWGLAAVVGVQILGLNLWAAHLNTQVKASKQAAVQLLKQTFPQTGAVLDAPLQMSREMRALRAQAGRVSDADFEAALLTAAAAWPADRPPVERLRFENNQLSLSIAGWDAPQIEQFQLTARSQGWDVRASQSELTMSRATPEPRR